MKRFTLLLLPLVFLLISCSATPPTPTTATEGTYGDDSSITRKLAAKTIALAFYTPEEIQALPSILSFTDVPADDWAYPYINAAVTLKFFSGDGENFFPDENLLLWEAQLLMDRLAPDYENRMVLTENNRTMPVSYSLWVELLQRALLSRRGEDSLYSYGIETQTQVLFSADKTNAFDRATYTADGYDLSPYVDTALTFLEKNGEIIALLAIADTTPTIENIYCTANGNQITLFGGIEKTYSYGGGEFSSGICNVTLENGFATIVEGTQITDTIVKRADTDSVYLSTEGALPWAENFRIYGLDFTLKKPSALISGTDLAEFYIHNDQVIGAVITKTPTPETIRVLLGGGLQDKITISSENGFSLSNAVGEKQFSTSATLTADLGWFDSGIVTLTGDVRLTFANGESRNYHAGIELERHGDQISIVNELPLEEYLLGVVPHEMPSSFGQAALEAQAISARSYAYNQFYANSYHQYGAHLTDTVANQVFLGSDTTPEAKSAVEATAGKCLVSDENLIAQTYFYSTSAGFGASDVEVWSKNGVFQETGKSYLTAQNHGITTATPTTEEEWLTFWKNWDTKGYDMDSPWFRWKVYWGAGQLSEIVEASITTLFATSPQFVQTLQTDGTWQNKLPANFATLTGLRCIERGTGGVMKILELSFGETTVRIIGENAIRKVLSPTKRTIGEEVNLQRKGGTLTGQTMLPSGFFAINEMYNDEGKLTGIALYGGGYGHGVGLSQYGAKYLSAQGYTGEEILMHYYPNTTVQKVLP